ncbi:MAG: glycosyltransferase family 4 protein [Desulfobacterales bacterium]|nr:glycosyltransferase family 4 protein [Desulfobacterales bacterium]
METFIALCARELAAELADDYRIVLYGPTRGRKKILHGGQKNYLDRLKNQICPRSAGSVRFTVALPHKEVSELYRRAAICILPSLWKEPFGIPAVEAMAAGVPVVASNRGGFAETVQTGLTGLLVPPGDSGEIVRAAERILSDTDLHRGMSLESQRRARTFSWKNVGAEARALYRIIMGRGR